MKIEMTLLEFSEKITETRKFPEKFDIKNQTMSSFFIICKDKKYNSDLENIWIGKNEYTLGDNNDGTTSVRFNNFKKV